MYDVLCYALLDLSDGISALKLASESSGETCLQAAGCVMDGAVDVIGAPARCCSVQYLHWPMQNRTGEDARMPFANFVGKVAAKACHSRKRASEGLYMLRPASGDLSVSTPLLTA